MNRFLQPAMAGACLVLLLTAGSPATAQPVRTLTIQDGNVLIDDHRVPPEDLPPSLDVQGVEASFSFVGNMRPMIELDGIVYVLEDRNLREVSNLKAEPGRFSVFFQEEANLPEEEGAPPSNLIGVQEAGEDADQILVMQEHAQALQSYSRELKKLGAEAEQQRANQLIEQARWQAEQAAQVAQALPRLQVQSYLDDVQRNNRGLYDELLREWRMEAEAQSLALQILNMPQGTERDQRLAELREKLSAMFELKQENRRREIEQLERQLDGLYTRLKKRESLRDRIIDQRLEELTGVKNTPDNQ